MINLITKYGKKLDKGFSNRSVVGGKSSTRFEWTGAKTIRVLHMLTNPLVDFNRTGNGNRYGTPKNIQDGVQEFTVRYDKAYSGTIDRGDNTQQGMLKRIGEWNKLQETEVVIPWFDTMTLDEWSHGAGQIITTSSAPTASTIIGLMLDMEVAMNNKHVPKDQRWTYVPETYMKYLRLADEFRYCDRIMNKQLSQGHMGYLGSLLLNPVPDDMLPTDCYALVARKDSVFAPTQLVEANVYPRTQGYSGPVSEFRRIGDAFVDWPQSNGVVALVKSSEQETAPTVSVAGQITVGSGKKVKYTLDGTDPRYSITAVQITSTATPTHTAGDTIKAVVLGESGKFTSAITTTVTTS